MEGNVDCVIEVDVLFIELDSVFIKFWIEADEMFDDV